MVSDKERRFPNRPTHEEEVGRRGAGRLAGGFQTAQRTKKKLDVAELGDWPAVWKPPLLDA